MRANYGWIFLKTYLQQIQDRKSTSPDLPNQLRASEPLCLSALNFGEDNNQSTSAYLNAEKQRGSGARVDWHNQDLQYIVHTLFKKGF